MAQPRKQTTMRMRVDVIEALDREAAKQTSRHQVPVSRSRIIENVLIDYVKKQGHRLEANQAPAPVVDPMG